MKRILVLMIFIVSSTAYAQKHEYVDLGLPSGTLWATCNIGAKSPEDIGQKFCWGETSPKQKYGWKNYKYANGEKEVYHEGITYDIPYLTKYCRESSMGYNGFTDSKTELQKTDDAAFVNWGTDWRIPTEEQVNELCRKCTYSVVSKNGIRGLEFTGSNGNKLFIPSPTPSDDYFGTPLFWISTLSSYKDDYASCYEYNFSKKTRESFGLERCDPLPVRPVSNNKHYVDLGLPSGTLWADSNVGAKTPEDNGEHFAWGELNDQEKEREEYNPFAELGKVILGDSYKPASFCSWQSYHLGDSASLKKYCTKTEYGKDGFVDGKTLLDYSDDVAYQRWGSNWCLPTYNQFKELITKCTWKHTERSGKSGVECVGPNGNVLFFPISELYYNGVLYTSDGSYWSRSLSDENPNRAFGFYLNSNEGFGTDIERCIGSTIRPVRNKD